MRGTDRAILRSGPARHVHRAIDWASNSGPERQVSWTFRGEFPHGRGQGDAGPRADFRGKGTDAGQRVWAQSEDFVAWAWDHRLSLLAADNFALECLPAVLSSPYRNSAPSSQQRAPVA